MNFFSKTTFQILVISITLLLPAILAWPASLLRGSRYGYGRNIRPITCIAKKQAGICMFAWDCMKANGTHLGTCIDRFYFGSCCQLKMATAMNEIISSVGDKENEIDSGSFSGATMGSIVKPIESSPDKINPDSPSEVVNSGAPESEFTSGVAEPETPSEIVEPASPSGAAEPESPSDTTEPESSFGATKPESTSEVAKPESTSEVAKPESPSEVAEAESPSEATNPESPSEISSDSGMETTFGTVVTDLPSAVESVTTSDAEESELSSGGIAAMETSSNTLLEESQSSSLDSAQSDFESSFTVTISPDEETSFNNSEGIESGDADSSNTLSNDISFDGDGDISSGLLVTNKPDDSLSNQEIIESEPINFPITESGENKTMTDDKLTDIPTDVMFDIINTSGTISTDEAPAPTDTFGITNPMESSQDLPSVSTSEFLVNSNSTDDTSDVMTTTEALDDSLMITEPSSVVSEVTADSNVTAPGINVVIDEGNETDNQHFEIIPVLPSPTDPIFPDVPEAEQIPIIDSVSDSGTNATTVEGAIEQVEFINEENGLDLEATTSEANADGTETTTEFTDAIGGQEEETVILDGEEVTKSPLLNNSMVTLIFPEDTHNGTATAKPNLPFDIEKINYEEQEAMIVEALKTANYQDVCGVPVYPSSRIVGGSEASYGQWPWQVSLRQWRSVAFLHKCGAALVNENWAITAAHCVEGIEPDQLLLVMGEFDLGTPKEPYSHVERNVQVIAMHPKFEPRTFEFDLALLRFAEPLHFQPNIIPICVPSDDYDFLNDTGYVTGWGRLYEDGPLPTVMQKVSVPIIPNKECEDMYKAAGYIEHIPNIFICAGYQAGKQDSCEGDSGGPLVINHKDRWNLAGVISWGIGCAVPNQPGVYTRISEFREWINKIIIF